MNKFKFFFKIGFYSANIILIILYLFPGSILGCFLYNDCNIQPQITRDFIISTNHAYAFALLSSLGVLSFHNNLIYFISFISYQNISNGSFNFNKTWSKYMES